MSDLSRFLKELDEQAHNDSVFSMFDDFDKKYADFTAREREWQEAFDAERKAKAEEINRYQQWDAHISEESVRAMMPELNNYIDSFPTTDAIDLNGYSTDELKSRLEKARATHADLLSDAEIFGESESAKDCIREQSALISLYRQELDRRAEA